MAAETSRRANNCNNSCGAWYWTWCRWPKITASPPRSRDAQNRNRTGPVAPRSTTYSSCKGTIDVENTPGTVCLDAPPAELPTF
eukprot:1657502-Lingulodinium_polyedra.AAC.1